MRRVGLTCSVLAMVLAIAPAAALARHHNSRHHSRVHHHTRHSVRFRQFGSATAPSTTSSSAPGTAGTVQSFNNGVLTLLLKDGSTTVSGTVDNTTKLDCMAAEESSGVHADGDRGGDNSGQSDTSGRGDDGSGDDNGSQTTSGQSSGDDPGDVAEQNESEAAEPTETEGTEPADNGNEHGNEAANSCSPTSLTPGATVREAVLRVSSGGSIWSKVELGS